MEDSDFDFLEWVEQRQGVQRKMRDFEGFEVSSKDIPWPEVTKVRDDGKIELVYALNVLYRKCAVCSDSQTGKGRQLATEYFNTKAFRDYLKKNENIVIKLIPSSSMSANQELSFTWRV